MVENLRLLFQDVPTVQINRYGSLRSWIHEASNEKYWCELVERLLHPSTPLPDQPDDWGPLPSWQARRDAAGHQQTNDPPNSDDKTSEDDTEDDSHIPPQPPPPPRHPPPAGTATDNTTYDPKRLLNDPAFCSMVGCSLSHSLKILGLDSVHLKWR